jgi:hypothetical protein
MKSYRRRIVRIAIAVLCGVTLSTVHSLGQPAAPQPNWNAWQFFIGEWVGEGGGDPGQGTGGFTFVLDLQKRILARKNYADYPATKDRPAFRHDDLMIVYQETGTSTRADYFDNEGHVIHYAVSFSKDSSSIIYVSEPSSSAPRFRMTNTKAGPDKITITFEIAPPGKPEAFSPYITASARRKR